ncbi:3-dehydroquinate synthase [Neobacillus ginsengisoli]|uniref:3-dehydroquinate synthase n=1 Tax=Neobacillus ginsengisoli TaxID=904295 RepID=A0ABT9XPP6_9BACI|nr:3-dehydroquinate synthase [Neobacillus ginsengisoli]MDQ0197512.1 3-dehydroquinate synthase [Neobacillus ginsengisoli]
METIHIHTESKNYDVFLGEGVLRTIQSFLANHFQDLTKILIITDETVAKIHLDTLLSCLPDYKPLVYTAPGGEKAKTFEVYYDALSTALENRLDRKSVILSFGGGAVGDLAGFVAATFMRGIPFIQIPTTILSHDSAVGGKVAINHPLGKNMIGAFHQPEAVFYDIDLLKTLPIQEIRSGFAEVIKHGLIYDPYFFGWLQNNVFDLNALTMEQLTYSLSKGIKIKREFVSKDEKETGVRAYLNFGHTLGHAVESEMGYGNFTHGESVLIGMIFALNLSKELQGLLFNVNEFKNWVTKLGYETRIPPNLSFESLICKMRQDKKSVGEAIRFVLLEQLGQPTLQEVSDVVLLDQLKSF